MTIFRSDGVRATANRKVKDDQVLNQDESERAPGIARLVGLVETVVSESGAAQGFDAARWTVEWLDAPNAALGGKPPGTFMDTADGRTLVSGLVAPDAVRCVCVSSDVTLWRIAADTPKHEADDLRGKGAEVSGGRWNRVVGTPLVYASTSRALACLETMMHLASTPLPLNRYLVRISLPSAAWAAAMELDAATLVGWDALPAGKASLDWGTRWAGSAAALLARVPSVVVPEEFNVLINPAHRDAADMKEAKVSKWLYDGRLLSAP